MRSSRVPSRGMSVAKGEQESTETLSFRCDCERCRLMRGRKGRFAPLDDMNLKGQSKTKSGHHEKIKLSANKS